MRANLSRLVNQRLEVKRLRKYGTYATRSEQLSQCGDEVDEKNKQMAHRRIVARRGNPEESWTNNNSPPTGRLVNTCDYRYLSGVAEWLVVAGSLSSLRAFNFTSGWPTIVQ